MILEISLLFVLLFIGILLWPVKERQKNQLELPPGPTGLPIFGSVFSLLTSTFPHVKFCEWANIYGNIFTVNIFHKKVVIVSCPKLLREIFEHPASSGKYDMEPILILSDGPYGITSTQGKNWSEQRKFNIRTLRQFGMGKSGVMETLILSEVDLALDWIRKESKENGAIIPIKIIKTATTNILWTLIRGSRQDYSQNANKFTVDFMDAFNVSVKRGLAVLPWLKWVAPKWSGYTNLIRSSRDVHNLIEKVFQERQNERNHHFRKLDEPRDMLDSYIDHLAKVNADDNKDSTFYGELGWRNTKAVMVETFAGGGESTPHTLNWLILFLTYHPKVQKRLQEEIDEVIGKQEPNLTNKSRMPYTEAVILETFRKAPAFPLTTVRKVTVDLNLSEGYKLPAGTLLMSNIYHTQMNERFWGDPEVFRPERFISEEDGNGIHSVIEKKKAVVPFNVGKRACPGEPLVMDVVFLFVVKFFQMFHVSPFPENAVADFTSSDPILMTAKPYRVIALERNQNQ